MNVLEKLKKLTKKRTFDEMPDMCKNGIEDFDLPEVAKACVEKIKHDGKEHGYENIEVKVVAIGVYCLVLNPNDKTRQEMVVSPMVVADKDVNFNEIMQYNPMLRDTDASKIVNPDGDEQEYKPDPKNDYDGHMYG
jgi:hypothetical protein